MAIGATTPKLARVGPNAIGGAIGGKMRENARPKVGDGGSDKCPSVASAPSTWGADTAPRDPGLLRVRGDPGGSGVGAAAGEAVLREIGAIESGAACKAPEMLSTKRRRTWNAAMEKLASARAPHSSPVVAHLLRAADLLIVQGIKVLCCPEVSIRSISYQIAS